MDMEVRLYQLSKEEAASLELLVQSNAEFIDLLRNSQSGLKGFLDKSGIPFPAYSSVFLDSSTSVLYMINTPDNLDLNEKALSFLPGSVMLKRKLFHYRAKEE